MKHSTLSIKHSALKCFTLIELMVVIAIIGIVVVMVVKNVGDGIDKANALDCKKDLAVLGKAMKAYKMEYGESVQTGTLDSVVKILKADKDACSSSGYKKNPKRIKFLDSNAFTKKKDDGSLETSHDYDSWGGTIKLTGSNSSGWKLESPGPDMDINADSDNVVYEWK